MFSKGDWRRFGNLMFNYASLLGIAESNNMIPLLKLDSQETELFDVFNISVANCSKEYFQPSSPGALKDVHNHSEYAALLYDERTQNLPHRHTQLIGAYESKNYFTSHRLQYKLRQEFTFRSKYMERAERFITGLKVRWAEHLVCAVREVLVVGVHVRRGDMASPKLQSQGYTPPGPSYFYKAMAYITQLLPSKKHIVFLISSDDITWCHKYLSGHTLFNRGYQHSSPNVTHKTDQQYITSNRTSFNTDFTDTGSYVVDLAILSLCDHMIISAGSYGWWAAWLAGGITIYYEDWPKPDSMLRGYFKATDYYYPDWIPLK